MHEPFGEHTFWPTLGQGASLVVHLAVQVVWMVVALTVVRRASRQAATLIVVATVVQLVLSCVSPFATAGLGVVASRSEGGMDSYLRITTLWSITATVLGAGLSGLLLAGVVRLAKDRARDVRDPDV